MKAVVLDDAGTYVRDCAVGEVGVLAIRGPNVFAGYRSAEHDRGLWIAAGDGERWMNTADLGRQDADGHFYLTGRKKELIIRGGHNIDPASIEHPLHEHPAVLTAAAVGRPDAHAGEVPVAYVQLRPGAEVSASELLQFAAGRIGERAAIPKAIHIVATMPLTAVGKIFKPELRLREIADALGEALRGANVSVRSLTASADPDRGTRVDVALDAHADRDLAERLLGQFPFQFRLEGAVERSASASSA